MSGNKKVLRHDCTRWNTINIIIVDKKPLTACSEAPMYLFNSSGPFTDMNRREQAAATAPTMCVLPQPGGPYKRTFDRSLRGACENNFGNFEGNSII